MKNINIKEENSFAETAKNAYMETIEISKSIEIKANLLIIAISFLFTGVASYCGVMRDNIEPIMWGLLVAISVLLLVTLILNIAIIYPTDVNSLSIKLPKDDTPNTEYYVTKNNIARRYIAVAKSRRAQNAIRHILLMVALAFYIVTAVLCITLLLIGAMV